MGIDDMCISNEVYELQHALAGCRREMSRLHSEVNDLEDEDTKLKNGNALLTLSEDDKKFLEELKSNYISQDSCSTRFPNFVEVQALVSIAVTEEEGFMNSDVEKPYCSCQYAWEYEGGRSC